MTLSSSIAWRNAIPLRSDVETIAQNLPSVYAQKTAPSVITAVAKKNSVVFCATTSP